MFIESRFAGRCRKCKGDVAPGDRVEWNKGKKGVYCMACSPAMARAEHKASTSRAETTDLEVPVPEGLAMRDYQRAGVAVMLEHDEGSLLADEPGLGKTIQVAGLMNSRHYARVVIVCPKSLCINWRRELSKWLLAPRDVQPVKVNPDAEVVVGSYEDAKKFVDTLAHSRPIDLLVIDEVHFCKNPKTQRAKVMAQLRANATKIVAMTGTPIVNRPVELFPILKLVAPQQWDPNGKGFFPFAKRYCDAHKKQVTRDKAVWDFNGASHLPELQTRLRSTCMVRRLKGDVLKELPSKVRQLVELPANAKVLKLDRVERTASPVDYEDALASLESSVGRFEEMSAIRRDMALAMLPGIVTHLEELLADNGDSLVIGAHHHEVIDAIAEKLAPFGVVTLTGNDNEEQRQRAVDDFQAGKARVFIGQIQAAGVGLTLTRASTVVLVELPWTPGDATQFEDRCHRIGQTRGVVVQHLVADGTLGAHMARVLIHKQGIADAALDEPPPERPKPVVIQPTEPGHKPRTVHPEGWERDGNTVRDVSPEHRNMVLDALRRIDANCDGAHQRDGAGWAMIDVAFGSSLASRSELTSRQAQAGLRLCRKYHRQLSGHAVLAFVDGTGKRKKAL